MYDGDTLELADGAKVRLDCIDAPEIEQMGGKEARSLLAKLIGGRSVELTRKGTDRYGRILTNVTVAGVNVNLRMVEAGHAWRYVKYCPDPRYAQAQVAAKSISAGLWASSNPVAPWEFRHAKQAAAPETSRSSSGRKLIRGPKGGCYFVDTSGSKKYVDQAACN